MIAGLWQATVDSTGVLPVLEVMAADDDGAWMFKVQVDNVGSLMITRQGVNITRDVSQEFRQGMFTLYNIMTQVKPPEPEEYIEESS